MEKNKKAVFYYTTQVKNNRKLGKKTGKYDWIPVKRKKKNERKVKG